MWIYSDRLVNYLMERGIYPVYEDSSISFYWKNKELKSALDSYSIRKAFLNRWEVV